MKVSEIGHERVSLTPSELEFFHLNGYVGPFTLCSAAEMQELRQQFECVLAPKGESEQLPDMISALNSQMQRGFGRHHEHRFLFDIADSNAIKGRVSSILGEDLLLWRTMFFNKLAGGKPIPWHQDFEGWQIEPIVVVSSWLAVDETTLENGCIEVIPGSHRHYYPLVAAEEDVMDGFDLKSDPAKFDESNAVSLCMEAGQFFLFNERLLHRSGKNNTGKNRLGYAMRYIPTFVRLLDSGDRGILISGQNNFQFNDLSTPPSE